jgi:thiol-disulfide isomerase/thioredoxin
LTITGTETVDEATGPVLQDSNLVLVETRLSAEYAVRPWIAIGASFPYRMVDVDVEHRNPMTGDPIDSPSMIHIRSERLTGAGDPALAVRLARELAGFRLFARLGVTLPLGRTEEDPHLLGSIGQDHQHIQLGTGTFVPFAALEAQRPLTPRITLAGFVLTYQSLVDNDKGFRAGDRISAGVSASIGVGRKWTFGAAVEGHAETAETWQGVVYETEGNAGRFDLYVGGSAAWRPMKRLAIIGDVRVPVVSRVEGTQLDYGFVVGIGVATTIDFARKPTYRGLDHGVVGTAGSAPDLVPVPGKITVFDLWADWCAPCRELDERLEGLSRAHPGRLAIRKLDVVDNESTAWKRYLPGFELPHVKVYGADGKLLFQRSAPPAELVRAIEQLLRTSSPAPR